MLSIFSGTQYGSSRKSESPAKSSPQEPKRKRRRRSRKEIEEEADEEEDGIHPEALPHWEEEEYEEDEEMERTLEQENTESVTNEENDEDNPVIDNESSVEQPAELVLGVPPPAVIEEVVASEGASGGTRSNSNGNANEPVRFACQVCNEEFRSRGCLQLHMGQKHTAGMPKLKKKSSLVRMSDGNR